MPTKLVDIAKRAGVSVTTASNALNDYTKSRIKQETIDHVKAIAAEMGYRPNEIARSLKRQRTDTIAFYNGYGLTDFRDRFYGEVITGIERSCANNGVDLLLFCTINLQNDEMIHRELTSGKVDGVIIHAHPSNPIAELLAHGSMPAVAIADMHENLASVSVETDTGMRQLIGLLWEQGHREIAFLAPAEDFESVVRRRESFYKAVEERGGVARLVQIDWADNFDHIIDSVATSGNVTAVCCWSDVAAYHFLAVCRASGVRVPEDISVAGFDGFLDGQFPARRATTVKIPWADIASAAVNGLIRMRGGEQVQRQIIYNTSLQPGDTVGAAPPRPFTRR